MRIGRRQRQSQAISQRAFPYMVEALEERRLLAVTALSHAAPVQTQITSTGAPVIGADVGDLNGDNIPDLVALDGVSPAGVAYTAQPFIGAATGTFKPGNLSVAGGQTFALGDFTGDGKLDLATPSGVLPGNGDGTFQTTIVGYNNPAGAVSFIAADFDGDGKLDLAVATVTVTGQNTAIGLDILLGNGNGTFKAPVVTNIKTGTTLTQLDAQFFVDDFNGDGKLDVLTPFGLFIGGGDGTFKPEAQALPITPSLVNPVYTSGDINDDGKPDLLIVGTKSASGQAEFLKGNGDGTFTDSGAVTIASTGTVTALTVVDLNADGFPEVIAGVQTSGSASEIALLTNNGSGAFGTATTFTVDGAPLEIFAADMNGDSVPDIISVDSTAGLSVGSVAGFNASEVAVLLSKSTSTGGTGTSGTGTAGTGTGSTGTTTTTTSTGLRPPDIFLKTSANPVVSGGSINLTVTVRQRSGIVYPSGLVTFSIAGRPIGTATLNKFGRATLAVKRLGQGEQPITASYPGDANFGPASIALSELVLTSLTKSPLVSASFPTLGFTPAFVAGDTGRATIAFANTGNATAIGTASVALYLTANGKIDAASIPLKISGDSSVNIALQRGQRQKSTFDFVAPKTAIGLYRVVAQVTAVSGITTTELTNTTLLQRRKFRAADNQFGIVSRKNRITANIDDGSGHKATFSMAGPGVATFTSTTDGIDLTLTGTTAKSILIVAGAAGFKIHHITASGAIRAIGAAGVNLTDGLSIGGQLKAISLGAATGGAWAVHGVGSIQISGVLSNTQIFAGANVGKDGVLGTGDDTFATSTIDSIYVGGAMTSSTVAAGVAPASGDTIFTKQVLLAKGRISSITVRGAVSADSRFIATILPTRAVLANRTVAVDGNVHFV